MDDQLLYSSELFQTFPRIRKSDSWDDQCSGEYNRFPKFTPVKSKYSSTETEISSEDDASEVRIRRDSSGIMTLSGLSTSTSSSGLSRKRKRRKRRKQEKLSLPRNESESGPLHLSIRSQESNKSTISSLKSHSERSWKIAGKRSQLPPLNSVNDLKHASGRHRGISGSFSPAIDSVLFAMFYTTDIFDYLFYDNEMRHHYLMESHNNSQMKRDILGILRKEIVYSLRTSYFCPAEKIVKLLRILEEHFPLERFQDPASFVDLLFSKVVNQNGNLSAFINYSNGSSNYIFQLPLNEQLWFTRSNNSNFEGAILTIQNLLEVYVNRGSNDLVGGSKFTTVPYPVFIIQVMRGSRGTLSSSSAVQVYYDDNHDIHLNGSTSHCDNRHNQNYPVIPNMEIDLTTLISQNGRNHNSHHKQKESWNEGEPNLSSSFMMASTSTREKYFGGEMRAQDAGRVGVRESRLMKGLKTAWKRMYRYLEDFASSPSTHFPSPENSFMDNYNESGGLPRSSLSSMQSPFFPRSDDNHYQLSRSPSPSSSSSLSFMSCSPHPRHHEIEESPSSIFTPISTSSRKEGEVVPQVKMELIAVICKSGGNVCGVCSNDRQQRSKLRNSSTTTGDGDAKVFSGYSVYCKAKSESDQIGREYAPWVLYQSRCGVAPQVTLIENFGKWISSLERNREDLSLNHVPLEIRRVMEDSELLIYQRIENSS